MYRNYWTCSKFADWLRGTMKPRSETAKGWTAWNKQAKKDHPVRYWIAEEGLDYAQDFVYWIPNRIKSVKHYIKNRYINKTHALTSTLPKGQWHELDTRILHCIFDELVEFVEVDKALMNWSWFEKTGKKVKTPDIEAGLDHLDWEISLKFDEEYGSSKTDQNYGQETPQATKAKEIKELYNWWKNIRPTRPDASDISGWSALCDARRKKYGEDTMFCTEDATAEERQETRKVLDASSVIEEQYEQEDEDMLIRIIKIRRGLWT